MTDGQITNRDLYEAQRDTEKQLGGLALQVATLVAEWRGVGERLDSGSARMADLDGRVRQLETAASRRGGMSAVMQALLMLAGSSTTAALVAWLLTRK